MQPFKASLLAGACVACWHAAALAQAQAPLAEPGVTTQDCQASPAPEGGAAQGATPPAAGDSLTATLDRCNGVLQPPPTGDAEIREAPPAQGETPVIPPGALPEQQPPADGSPQQNPPATGTNPA